MDHNRRGLALMLAALLISILVAAVRSCDDKTSERFSHLDQANQALVKNCYAVTAPIRDYRITSIQEGIMTVDAGPTLTTLDVQTLARKLTQALHDADHVDLGSDYVGLDMYRSGKRICSAQTTEGGRIAVKLVGP